jgi:hypothetical protein
MAALRSPIGLLDFEILLPSDLADVADIGVRRPGGNIGLAARMPPAAADQPVQMGRNHGRFLKEI